MPSTQSKLALGDNTSWASLAIAAGIFAAGALAVRGRQFRRFGVFGYPRARKVDEAEELHGVRVPDPYRWLENPDAPETRRWVAAQNSIFESYRAGCALREPFFERLKCAFNFPKIGCPSREGDAYYMWRNEGLQNQSILYVKSDLRGSAHVFLDPNKLSADGTVAVTNAEFSRDGKLCALALAASGSDWNTIRVRRVLDGAGGSEELPDAVDRVKFSDIAWSHDASNPGFFYARYPEGDDGTATTRVGRQQVCFHKLGTPCSEDEVVFQNPAEPDWIYGVTITEDGRYLLISPSSTCDPVNRLYVCDLAVRRDAAAEWPVRRLVDNFEAQYTYLINVGQTFYFRTNLHAPRGRIVRVTLPDLTDDRALTHFSLPAELQDVVPQTEHAMEGAHVVRRRAGASGYALVVQYLRDVMAHVQLHDLDGSLLETLPVPPLSNVQQVSAHPRHSEMFFSIVSYTSPGTILRYDADTNKLEEFERLEAPGLHASDFAVQQVFYTSSDGTRVPMTIIRSAQAAQRAQAGERQPSPCVLYGYGGFSVALTPSFSVTALVFAKHFGGVFAIANIRGGSEYGEEWHKAAIVERKQRSFDDFIAAGEFLVEHGYTSPAQLVINGGSNGGMLVTACANQRPDLYAAVVAQVPVTDMFRFHKFTIGYAWTSDYGCADSREHFLAQREYSPLHTIRKRATTQFPAVLVTTADHDDRVVPLHSYKYMATLQEVAGSDPQQTNPLLMRVETKAGHGAGKPTSKRLEEVADMYGFILRQTGARYAEGGL